jgi:choice-of-anchor B domain-containing protein
MRRWVVAGVALALATLPSSLGVAHVDGELPPPSGDGSRSFGRIQCQHGAVVTDAFTFPCWEVDLLAWDSLGGFPTLANDLWGWTDPDTGRDYAILGLSSSTAFFDLGNPEHPVHLGNLPSASGFSFWADIKVHANHAYIVKDVAGNHGLQVFDLTQLRDITNPPVSFTATAHYQFFGPAHNLAINEETGFLYSQNADTCQGLGMMDVSEPALPVWKGCVPGWFHDAQCVVYEGPDSEHLGREICFAANPGQQTLTIIDVEDKAAPRRLSDTDYLVSLGYAHQGWLSEDQEYFLFGDEFDELGAGHNTRTYVFDVSDLDAPFLVGHYEGPHQSTDHNLYVRDDYVFEANYSEGLRILRMGDLGSLEIEEVAFFDTFPPGDQAGTGFGPWSVYPFFESGIVVVSDILLGLFVLQPHVLEVLPVEIRVKSSIQPASRGVITVTIPGSETLHDHPLDPSSLAFGPDGARLAHRNGPHEQDVNGDELTDLVAHFRTADTGISPNDETACLTGETLDGIALEGCAEVRTVPPK